MYRRIVSELDYALKLDGRFGYHVITGYVVFVLATLAYAVSLEIGGL